MGEQTRCMHPMCRGHHVLKHVRWIEVNGVRIPVSRHCLKKYGVPRVASLDRFLRKKEG